MKCVRFERWAIQVQPPRNPRLHLLQQRWYSFCEPKQTLCGGVERWQNHVQHQWRCQRRRPSSERSISSSATAQVEIDVEEGDTRIRPRAPLPSRASRSAKLAALHARLSLPTRLPLETLARCLVDPSVDPRPGYNNQPFAILGQDLLGYYTAEWLMCRYPRLPMSVLFAAQYAYVGSETLAAMRSEWGVDVVAAPGQEVNPGLLQLKRVIPGNAMAEDEMRRVKDTAETRRAHGTGRPNESRDYRRGLSSRIVFDDQFGDLQTGLPPLDTAPFAGAPTSTAGESNDSVSTTEEQSAQLPLVTPQFPLSETSPPNAIETEPTTVEAASASFIRALVGALYLHSGSTAAQAFHKDHVLSRQLRLHTLFNFTYPTRDLNLLCRREGFEPPVARLISETGRLSRTPVFVVGVYSGDDKLGEGAGSSLNEARVRAAAAALRSWYLYSPPESEIILPSAVEGSKDSGRRKWKSQMVDIGEIIP